MTQHKQCRPKKKTQLRICKSKLCLHLCTYRLHVRKWPSRLRESSRPQFFGPLARLSFGPPQQTPVPFPLKRCPVSAAPQILPAFRRACTQNFLVSARSAAMQSKPTWKDKLQGARLEPDGIVHKVEHTWVLSDPLLHPCL